MESCAKNTLAVMLVALATAVSARAQHVVDPLASVVDVAVRQAVLKSTAEPLLVEAMKSLPSSLTLPFVVAPSGRMIIPSRYFSGAHGPINPAEAAATSVYHSFEDRITAGMLQYLVTGNHKESACALDQLDAWAKAGTLLDYSRDESQQAWFQVEWTVSAAGITDSVLVNDSTLDPAQQRRVIAWLAAAAHKDISSERPTDAGNNHHYWRALAATSVGVIASDDSLFRFGVETYKQAIGEIDPNGAFPMEMARHEYAIHYQGFALQPLVLIAQLAARQGYDLYSYQVNGRTLRDAIVFYGRAVDDPGLVKPYTSDEQNVHFGPVDFAPFAFYAARFGPEGLPTSITNALKHPVSSTRIGGSATILAAK